MLITRLRLGLSYLRDHKFKYNFLDCLNPICCCGKDMETAVHYLLHCPIFSDERSIFFSDIFEASMKMFQVEVIVEFLSRSYLVFLPFTKNKSILSATVDYTLSTKRFDVPLTNFLFILKHLCIENMSFKFYNLIVNWFTKFLPNYVNWFRYIAFTLPYQLGFSSNYYYFYIRISTVFILFVY